MEDQLIAIMAEVLLAAEIITASTPVVEIPIFRQGSLGEADVYPDTFMTFWNGSESELTAYDNDTATVVWSFDANAYSTDPAKAYSLTAALRKKLKAAGWQTPDRGHDVGSDVITHTGRGISVTYLTTYTPNEAEPAAASVAENNPQEEQANG